MSRYAWIITADLLADDVCPSRVGIAGPQDATDAQITRLKAGEGALFRTLDSDGNVYHVGRYLGDQDSEDAFGPLDDFSRPDAGAVEIQYSKGPVMQLEWQTL